MKDSINGFANATITTLSNASGGSEKEDIESIKFKATKFYTSQNRLVTLNDYKAKVSEYYPNADAVAVWGGEDNDPPQYGKVFLAIKPLNSDYLSTTEKTVIKNKLNGLNMLTVRPEIVDAEIVKILLSTTFKYNERATTLSKGELETVVTNAINRSKNIILILHGLTKNIPSEELKLTSDVKKIIVQSEMKLNFNQFYGKIIKYESINEIKNLIKSEMQEGDTVLFSCGGASFNLSLIHI